MVRLAALVAFLATLLPAQVHVHGRFEASFFASREYPDPLSEVTATVIFHGPGGSTGQVDAFWDGGKTWKVRYSPARTGRWSFKIQSNDEGLNGRTGTFRVSAYSGKNLLYRSGAPRLSANHRYFVLADGKPWFYLACTGWNSALLSTDEEWKRYLDDRASKRFTAIQFVLTQWRAGRQDENSQAAYEVRDGKVEINPAFYQRMDRKFDQLNDRGLAAAPVLLWALSSKDNESPGTALSESQAAALARYMVARYGAHATLWLLGGDGDYRGEKAERWKKIGRAVFPEGRTHGPVTLHPRGQQDPWPGLKDEPWLDFFMYQTGHGSTPQKWKWNALDGPASGARLHPPHPVVDGEPNYEGHQNSSGQRIGDADVRRAVYYSLLSAPPAGVTYGAHGIWFWSRKAEVPLDHPRSGVAEPWQECLNYAGARQMKVLRDIFDGIEWWKLRPDRSLLVEDQVDAQFHNVIMPAISEDGRFALIYFPEGKGKLNLTRMGASAEGTWIDPCTGVSKGAMKVVTATGAEVTAPDSGDWLLLLKR
jgi:hypothetical protein